MVTLPRSFLQKPSGSQGRREIEEVHRGSRGRTHDRLLTFTSAVLRAMWHLEAILCSLKRQLFMGRLLVLFSIFGLLFVVVSHLPL